MVDAPFQPDKMPPIGPKPPTGPTGPGPNADEFQSLMHEKTPGAITPLQISPQKVSSNSPSMEGLLKQIDTTQGSIKNLQNNLEFPQLKLKKAHERLIKDKLQNVISDIGGAAKASKTPLVPPTNTENMQPIAKFLSFIGDGHSQLDSVKGNLSEMVKKNKNISPANMLLMQVKIAEAQQNIEFSSILLSKVIDGIKQTLNIQIQ